MTLLEKALEIASRGIPVFPCLPSKAPACPHGFKDSTADPEMVRWLFIRAPAADRIGMPTGEVTGISVIDVDPAGMAWYDAHAHRFPTTRMNSTPRGGRHLFFVHPNEGLRCSTSKLAPGIDVKGDHGCITIFGPGYETLDFSPFAKFPRFVLRRLHRIDAAAERERRKFEARMRAAGQDADEVERRMVNFVCRLGNGERNGGLFWAACRVGAAGGSGEALQAAAMSVGLSSKEAQMTVASGLARGRKRH